LGLSLAQQIVVQYGGRIDLESEAGRGTMVQMMLPFAG
jgi:signal transduction histidine kinase